MKAKPTLGPAASPATGILPATGVRWAVPAALALWGLLAFVNYLAHHPIRLADVLTVTVAPLLSLTWQGLLTPWPAALKAASVLLAELLAAWPLGLLIYEWLGVTPATRDEKALFSFLLGLGAFALLVLATGLAGFYSASSYATLLAVSAAAGMVKYKSLAAAIPPFKFRRPQIWLIAGLAAVAVTQAGALLSGFSPPHISDELIYHLGTARWYLWHGKCVLQPGMFNAAMPQMDTMLYGAPVAFGLLYGVKWIHWVAGGLTAWGLHRLLREQRPELRWIALLAFGTMPTVWVMAGRAFSDLFVCAYAAGALIAARRAREARGSSQFAHALLAGVCIGLAGGYKYTGLLLGLLLLPFLPWRTLAAAGGAAALVMAPWFVKNWIWLGNPVYPYFLGGLDWDSLKAWRRQKMLMEGEITMREQLARIPSLPWNLSVHNLRGGPDSSIGPLFTMGIALLFCTTSAREALAMAGFFLPCVLGSAGIRYLLPLLPLTLVVMARGVKPLLDEPRRRRFALAGLVVLLWYQAVEFFPAGWKLYDNPLPHILGQEPLPHYLDRNLYPPLYYPPTYSKMIDAAEQETPPHSRVLLLGGYGGAFYLKRPTYFGSHIDRPLPLTLLRESRTSDHLRTKFKQMGVTHVLINRRHNSIFFDTWRMWDWESGDEVVRWRDFWDRYAKQTWMFQNHYALFRLSALPVIQPHQLTPGIEDEETRLALFRVRKRNFATADSQIKSLLGLFPQNPTLWLRSAQSFAQQGRLDEALRCCNQVAELAPESNDYKRCLAELAWVKGRYAEAATLLSEVLQHEADDAQGWADLRGLYLRLNRTDLAAQAYREYQRTKFP